MGIDLEGASPLGASAKQADSGHRPGPRPARPVPDRALPGADLRAEPGRSTSTSWSLSIWGEVDEPVHACAGTSSWPSRRHEVTDRHPLRHALVQARHDVARRAGPRPARAGAGQAHRHARHGPLRRRLHDEHPARGAATTTTSSSPTRTTASRSSPTTARRCGCSSPSGTSGSRRSSCASSRSCPRTARGSGSSTATTTTPTPGPSSGTGSRAVTRDPASPAPRARSARALLRRLTADGRPVRCLVRDPRRLGRRARPGADRARRPDRPAVVPQRAARGEDRRPPRRRRCATSRAGSIEELNGIATWRLVQAAERAGVEHFVFFCALSALGRTTARGSCAPRRWPSGPCASRACRTRSSPRRSSTRRGDRHARAARAAGAAARRARCPGRGRRAVPADLGRGRRRLRRRGARSATAHGERRYELAGPDTLDHEAIAELVLRAAGRARPLLRVPERAHAAPRCAPSRRS